MDKGTKQFLNAQRDVWRNVGRKNRSAVNTQKDLDVLAGHISSVNPFDSPGEQVIVAGDWHDHPSWGSTVVKFAAEHDIRLILQVGDFGFGASFDSQKRLERLNADCEDFDVNIAVVDGNHEDFDWLERYPITRFGLRAVRPRIWHIPRGHRWTWDNTVWVGVGGAVSVDRAMLTEGKNWWPQEALTEQQAAQVIQAGPADIMLTHDRPSSVAVAFGETPGSWHDRVRLNGWAKKDLIASDEHSARLQTVVDAVQPKRLFHGHMHQQYVRTVEHTSWGRPYQVVGLHREVSARNFIFVQTDGTISIEQPQYKIKS